MCERLFGSDGRGLAMAGFAVESYGFALASDLPAP
jgi:hypothetical protein